MLSILYPVTLGVMETVNDVLDGVNDQIVNALNDFLAFFDGKADWMMTVAFLLIAIFILFGLFVFIKKFIKLFIVLAILGAVGYYLYTSTDIFNNLLGFISFNKFLITYLV